VRRDGSLHRCSCGLMLLYSHQSVPSRAQNLVTLSLPFPLCRIILLVSPHLLLPFHLVYCSSTWRYFSSGILCFPRFIGTFSYISDLWHCLIKTRNAPRSSSSLSGMTRFHGLLSSPQWLLRSTYFAHLPLSSHQRGMLFSQIVRLGPEGMASDSTFLSVTLRYQTNQLPSSRHALRTPLHSVRPSLSFRHH